MPEPSFTYDPLSQRYRAENGRYVSEGGVRQAVDTVVVAGSARLAALTERLRDGTLDLPTWQTSMAAELKSLHLATATAARGGWAQMSQADFGWTGQRLRMQYAYLRDWAAQLAAGTAPLDSRAVARATLYADAARTGYQEMRRRDGRLHGATEERRVRRASESCPGCVAQAARGWQPAGTLPALGSEACRARCRCLWMTRRVPASEAA